MRSRHGVSASSGREGVHYYLVTSGVLKEGSVVEGGAPEGKRSAP